MCVRQRARNRENQTDRDTGDIVNRDRDRARHSQTEEETERQRKRVCCASGRWLAASPPLRVAGLGRQSGERRGNREGK